MTTKWMKPKEKEVGVLDKGATPALSAVIEAAADVRAAVAQLNAALEAADKLRIVSVIVRVAQPTDYSVRPPKKGPLQYKINRLDFTL